MVKWLRVVMGGNGWLRVANATRGGNGWLFRVETGWEGCRLFVLLLSDMF